LRFVCGLSKRDPLQLVVSVFQGERLIVSQRLEEVFQRDFRRFWGWCDDKGALAQIDKQTNL